MAKPTTYYKKRDYFLEAYRKSGCNINIACKNAKIARATFYLWQKEYPRFKEMIEDSQEGLMDLVESKAIEQIRDGNTQMIMFWLKTKGKNRGYSERQEIVGSINLGLQESERLQKIVEELDNGDKEFKDSRDGKD